MSMLEEIKNAEQQADELKKQAAADARSTLRQAQEKAHAQAAEVLQETVAAAEAAAKTEAEAAITQKKGEADAVAAKARKNLPQAVDYIMEKVVIAC